MRRFLVVAVACTFVSTTHAHAWDYYNTGPGQQIGDNATGVQNNLRASATQGQAQRQGQAQGQAQGQSTRVGAGAGAAANQGNSQTVNVGGNGGYSAHFPVNSAIAPSVMTVNPCGGGAASGALQTGVFGISLGGSVHFDQMCQIAMYSSNPYAFQWACNEMQGFRQSAMEAYRGGFAPHPCAQDVAFTPSIPVPPPVLVEPPVKRWAVVPCHMPWVRDARGRCINPNPPRPKPVVTLEPANCHDLVAAAVRECRAEEKRP